MISESDCVSFWGNPSSTPVDGVAVSDIFKSGDPFISPTAGRDDSVFCNFVILFAAPPAFRFIGRSSQSADRENAVCRGNVSKHLVIDFLLPDETHSIVQLMHSGDLFQCVRLVELRLKAVGALMILVSFPLNASSNFISKGWFLCLGTAPLKTRVIPRLSATRSAFSKVRSIVVRKLKSWSNAAGVASSLRLIYAAGSRTPEHCDHALC